MEKKILKILPKTFLMQMLILYLLLIYRTWHSDVDEMTRNISLWRYSLTINAAISALACFFVVDRISITDFGEKLDIAETILNGDSSYSKGLLEHSGLIINSIVIGFILVLALVSKNQALLNAMNIALEILLVINTVYYLSEWIKVRVDFSSEEQSEGFLKAMWPIIFFIIQLLLLNKNVVQYFYSAVTTPEDYLKLTIALIILLIYLTAILYCHYSNIYYFIESIFSRNRIDERIRNKINNAQESLSNKQKHLVRNLEHIEQHEDVGTVSRIRAASKAMILRYYYDRLYALKYIMLQIFYKIATSATELLEPKNFRRNRIQFYAWTIVAELLALNIILPGYLGENHLCTRIFNLISTLIIIPVLLSWILGVKDSSVRYKVNRPTQ